MKKQKANKTIGSEQNERFHSHSGQCSSEHEKRIVWNEFKQTEMTNVVARWFLWHESFLKINLFTVNALQESTPTLSLGK